MPKDSLPKSQNPFFLGVMLGDSDFTTTYSCFFKKKTITYSLLLPILSACP